MGRTTLAVFKIGTSTKFNGTPIEALEALSLGGEKESINRSAIAGAISFVTPKNNQISFVEFDTLTNPIASFERHKPNINAIVLEINLSDAQPLVTKIKLIKRKIVGLNSRGIFSSA